MNKRNKIEGQGQPKDFDGNVYKSGVKEYVFAYGREFVSVDSLIDRMEPLDRQLDGWTRARRRNRRKREKEN
jgi:hypothetical protein